LIDWLTGLSFSTLTLLRVLLFSP